MHCSLALLVLAFAAFANAAIVALTVGSVGSLTYSPANTVVNLGDIVTWTWASGPHTVTQSTTMGGCTPLAGGFSSASQSTGTFTWTVTGTGPWYYHCSIANHCQLGMVGTLTLASNSSTTAVSGTTAASGTSTSVASGTNASTASTTSASTPNNNGYGYGSAAGQTKTSWVIPALAIVCLTAMLV